MKTLFQALARGFHTADPRLEQEAKRIEEEEERKTSTKQNALSGYRRVVHCDNPFAISRWLREEGRGIGIEPPQEIEVWQRGDHFRLAVRNDDTWEVYVIIPDLTCYQLRRKLV